MMAEVPELRARGLAPRPPEPRHLYGRPHSYGVSHDLERMRQGFSPPPRTPRVSTRSRRRRGGPLLSARRWWAGSTNRPVDMWHRFRCRTGHHEIRGGHQMQLGSRFVHVERRCIWCEAAPPL